MRLSVAILALAILIVVGLKLALASFVSFDALTCDTRASCADLYLTCQGAYLCQDEMCEVMKCSGAPDTGARHGEGFVWLAGAIIMPLYALFLARYLGRRQAVEEVDIDL